MYQRHSGIWILYGGII